MYVYKKWIQWTQENIMPFDRDSPYKQQNSWTNISIEKIEKSMSAEKNQTNGKGKLLIEVGSENGKSELCWLNEPVFF